MEWARAHGAVGVWGEHWCRPGEAESLSSLCCQRAYPEPFVSPSQVWGTP